MKLLLQVFLFSLSILYINQAQAKVKVSYGDTEILSKVAELPKTEEFMIKPAYKDTRRIKVNGDKSKPAQYADVGILYTEFTIAGIPLWLKKDPKLVLINDSDLASYYEVPADKMDAILSAHNLKKEDLLELSFVTKYFGKLLMLVIMLLVALGIYLYAKEGIQSIKKKFNK